MDEKKKCTREWHDAYGDDYDKCQQCFIRDNGPWEENPWLMKPDELEKWLKKKEKE